MTCPDSSEHWILCGLHELLGARTFLSAAIPELGTGSFSYSEQDSCLAFLRTRMSARRIQTRFAFFLLLLAFLASPPRASAQSWTVRVEEPTGIYPRSNEVV